MIPPISPAGVPTEPQTFLYIGGVPTERRQTALITPVYKSNVAGLLGCVRGLMVGNQLFNLRNTSYWAYYESEKGKF